MNFSLAFYCKPKESLSEHKKQALDAWTAKVARDSKTADLRNVALVSEIDWPIDENGTMKKCLIKEPNVSKTDFDVDEKYWKKLEDLNVQMKQEIDFYSSFSFFSSQLKDNFVNFEDCFIGEDNKFFSVLEKLDFDLDRISKIAKVQGQDKLVKIPFGKLPGGIKFLYLKSMIDNVKTFHNHDYLHNDISPRSFMATRADAQTKLTDFAAVSSVEKYENQGYLTFAHPLKRQYNALLTKNASEAEKALQQIRKIGLKKLDVWSLGISFILLVDPALGKVISDIPEDCLDIKEKLKPLFKDINDLKWYEKSGLDLHFSEGFWPLKSQTHLKDIIQSMVNIDDEKIEANLDLLSVKMDLIYFSNDKTIENDRFMYFYEGLGLQYTSLKEEKRSELIKDAKLRLTKASSKSAGSKKIVLV